MSVMIPDDQDLTVVEHMTQLNENQRGVQRPNAVITPKNETILGCWNVRTMYEIGKSAQIAREMKNYRMGLLGISEVRWTGFGKTKLNTGESIIFSGRDDTQHREGVAIMMTREVEKTLMEWKPVNERIIMARFFSKFVKMTIIQVYAPTNEATDEDKDCFYEQLQATLDKVPKHDLIVVMGDLNAKVGESNEGCEDIMGIHGIGTINDNGDRLVSFAAFNNLIITGTIFPHRIGHKQTWISPDGTTRNQIDHVLVSRQHRTSVLDTRAMRGADVGSDHHLVRTKLKLKLKRHRIKKSPTRKRFATVRLQQLETRNQFSLTLRNKFDTLKEPEDGHVNVEHFWQGIQRAYTETAKEVLGFSENKQKPWMSNRSWKLIDERKALKKRIEGSQSQRIKGKLRQNYRSKDREVKKSVRRDKREWAESLALEAENAAQMGRMKTVYDITKKLSNEKRKVMESVRDKAGHLITEELQIRSRWKEHFEEILNRPEPEYPVEQPNEDEISEVSERIDCRTDYISIGEIRRAMGDMKNKKAPGRDGITIELLKADNILTESILKELFEMIWDKEEVPSDWTKGIIIKIPKKGDLTICDNSRGITLLSVPSKVLARALINRIRDGVDKELRDEQAGFRKGRSTVEQLFILRNIIEQSVEWQAGLYINFIDFEKAFDSVHRESLWNIMKCYGIPDKLIRMVQLLYKDTQCAIIDGGEESEWFSIKTGVKQGCAMSGFLFLLILDYVMRKTTKDKDTGIRWKLTTKLEDLDFADDIALLSPNQQLMQRKTLKLQELAARTGLKVSTKKSKVMRINGKSTEPIVINGKDLDETDKFTYLGGVVTAQGGGGDDITCRIGKARTAFRKLNRIWKSSNYSIKTKVQLYSSLVKSVLLYGCETWRMNEGDARRLDIFQFTCMRRILKIRWPYVISNEDLMKRTKTKRVSTEIKTRRWKWIGHVLRMERNSHCRTALTWQPEGKRKRGRPRTTWRRTVERERKEMGIASWEEARNMAVDRSGWRMCVLASCAS